MASATAVSLTSNDARVLHALFDPESSPSSIVRIEPTPQTLPHTPESLLPTLESSCTAAIRPLNDAQPSLAAIDAALDALTSLIAEHPDYAPAYANRAQVLRMKLGATLFQPPSPSSSLSFSSTTSLATTLFADLARAIALASPAGPGAPLSPMQASLLATTHTHRAYLLMKAATAAGDDDEGGGLGGARIAPQELVGVGCDELEEMASRDFFLGGRYGNREARQMAVRTNPYAKMCGAIVKEAVRKEVEGARGLREEMLSR